MQLPLFALAPKRLTCCTVKPSVAIVYSLTGPTAVPRGVGSSTGTDQGGWGTWARARPTKAKLLC